jgi:hypothetical protein
MRKIVAICDRNNEGIIRAMIHNANEGYYLFLYRKQEDGPCDFDEFYKKLDDLNTAYKNRFGIEPNQWKDIADPQSGTQQDWIKPTRIKRDSNGEFLYGQFEQVT